MDHWPMLTWIITLPIMFSLFVALLPDNDRLVHRLSSLLAGGWFLTSVAFFWKSQVSGHSVSELISWIPSLGVHYAVNADGVSWALVLLTTFLVFVATLASWTSIDKRVKFYYSMLFILAASIVGVFLARDLFLFFLFYELELIPMYFLIAVWGGARREFAAMKFVLYTLFGSVFLFAAILGLFLHAKGVSGIQSFLFTDILATIPGHLSLGLQMLVFASFFIAFAVKLPMVPFHTWLPDAHVEAPTPVSMLLAGILLKMGAYGMFRFCFEWFPPAAAILAPYVGVLGTINILYTAGVAMVQADLKKLVAYSSVSHMGFVLLGFAALNTIGITGAILQMLTHGLISAGLFLMVGVIYTRTHTRLIADLGGFAKQMPVIYYFSLLTCLASLGLPLLAGFPAETLVFYGAYLSKAFSAVPLWGGGHLGLSIQVLTGLSAIGVVLGAAYLLWMVQRVFTGPVFPKWESLKDIVPSEAWAFSLLTIGIIGFGFMPQALVGLYSNDMASLEPSYSSYSTASMVAPVVPKQALVPTHKQTLSLTKDTH